ncbi:MAG: hypothetical protein COA78_07805 [Blastopirellula sp.]|nr:MAG: hypothetical protein COA78_07805 [Blastopirellula sp.]
MSFWLQQGGLPIWAITEPLWNAIQEKITSPSMRTLETGSGLSTCLFAETGCELTALEHHLFWASRITELLGD